MKRWIPTLVAAMLLFVGCGGCEEDPVDDGSPDATDVSDIADDTSEPDDGGADTGDATDTADTSDALDTSDADAADTTDTADVSPSVATVTVTWGPEPAEGVRVLAHDADAGVTADVTTDADGEAVVEVTDGSMITLIDAPPNDYTRYLTLTDIAPGDTIDLDFAANTSPNRTLEVALPGAATGASRYEILGACNYRGLVDPSTPAIVGIRSPCSDTETDILALARQTNDSLVAYTSAENVQTSGGTTDVSLDPWKTDVVPAEFQFVDIPTTTGLSYSSRLYLRQDPQRWQVGRAFGGTNSSASLQESFMVPPDIGQELVVTYSLRFPDNTDADIIRTSGADFLPDRTSGTSSVVTGEQLMPLISSITVQDRDTARPAAQWDTEPVVTGGQTAMAADASLTRVVWTGMNPTSGEFDGSPGVSPNAVKIWVVMGPNDAQSLRFPRLPDDIDTPAEGTDNAVTAGLVDARDVDGYAEFKATPDVADLFDVQDSPFYPGLTTREDRPD